MAWENGFKPEVHAEEYGHLMELRVNGEVYVGALDQGHLEALRNELLDAAGFPDSPKPTRSSSSYRTAMASLGDIPGRYSLRIAGPGGALHTLHALSPQNLADLHRALGGLLGADTAGPEGPTEDTTAVVNAAPDALRPPDPESQHIASARTVLTGRLLNAAAQVRDAVERLPIGTAAAVQQLLPAYIDLAKNLDALSNLGEES